MDAEEGSESTWKPEEKGLMVRADAMVFEVVDTCRWEDILQDTI